MQKIEESEQWLLDADCDKCRRNNYCSKPCTRFKRIETEMMKEILSTAYKNAQKRIEEDKENKEEKDEAEF